MSSGRGATLVDVMNFEKYAATGNAFVNEVADALHMPDDRDRAGRILRAVLHALRARLTMVESFHLLAQLPMVLKGVYVDGWNPTTPQDKRIKTVEDLVDQVMLLDGTNALRDFPNVQQAERAIAAVLGVLKRHISVGEVDSIEQGLPHALKRLWHAA
jgi:uncharacterized protein (DUF2267 family)